MIRWYVIHRGDPLTSPLSGAPYVFGASTKAEAEAYRERVFTDCPLIVRSVAEHEAMIELRDAAVRAKAYDDGLLAYGKTLPVPEEYEEDEHQMSLCRDPKLWGAAA